MMRHLVRGATLLLVLGLVALFLAQQELRFVLAAVAIACLVEVALALRMRRDKLQARTDRSGFAAARISCTEEDQTVSVALVAEPRRRGTAPYVLLSRSLLPQAPAAGELEPYLELSDRRWSVHGGIRDAYLSPQLLRVTLDARAAEVLEAQEVCIRLQPGFDQRRLERSLRRILRGVAFVSERSMPDESAAQGAVH
jgi:hypothetical protein